MDTNNLQKYGQENYEKELLEMIDRCQFTYTLEGITYTIKSSDIGSIVYSGYDKKRLLQKGVARNCFGFGRRCRRRGADNDAIPADTSDIGRQYVADA